MTIRVRRDTMSRDDALALLHAHVKNPSLVNHMKAVEAALSLLHRMI